MTDRLGGTWGDLSEAEQQAILTAPPEIAMLYAKTEELMRAMTASIRRDKEEQEAAAQ